LRSYLRTNWAQEHSRRLDGRRHGTLLAKQRAPAVHCPDCDRNLEFSDPPELYFMFLAG